MNCVDCQAKLEDYLYRELDRFEVAEVGAHLEGCAPCSVVRDQLEMESMVFARFYEETALEPTAEMWEAISARIRTESAVSPAMPPAELPQDSHDGWLMRLLHAGAPAWLFRPVVLRQAAFAMLLIAISVSATVLFLKLGRPDEKQIVQRNGQASTDPSPMVVASPTSRPSPPAEKIDSGAGQTGTGRTGQESAPQQSPPFIRRSAPSEKKLTDQEILNQQIARAEREYRSAIKLLDRAIAKRKNSFDQDLVRQYEASLALIDDSIAASRKAFRERPGDLAAGQFLLSAYARKVELMQEIALR